MAGPTGIPYNQWNAKENRARWKTSNQSVEPSLSIPNASRPPLPPLLGEPPNSQSVVVRDNGIPPPRTSDNTAAKVIQYVQYGNGDGGGEANPSDDTVFDAYALFSRRCEERKRMRAEQAAAPPAPAPPSSLNPRRRASRGGGTGAAGGGRKLSVIADLLGLNEPPAPTSSVYPDIYPPAAADVDLRQEEPIPPALGSVVTSSVPLPNVVQLLGVPASRISVYPGPPGANLVSNRHHQQPSTLGQLFPPFKLATHQQNRPFLNGGPF